MRSQQTLLPRHQQFIQCLGTNAQWLRQSTYGSQGWSDLACFKPGDCGDTDPRSSCQVFLRHKTLFPKSLETIHADKIMIKE